METVEEFDTWLRNRWNEKEVLLDQHARTGRFPSQINKGDSITTEIKLDHWWGIWQIGAVLGPVVLCIVIARLLFG